MYFLQTEMSIYIIFHVYIQISKREMKKNEVSL